MELERVEDFNVIDKDNNINDYRKYTSTTEVVDNKPYNKYPVMYVDGLTVFEYDKILFKGENELCLRRVCHAHRGIVPIKPEWADGDEKGVEKVLAIRIF